MSTSVKIKKIKKLSVNKTDVFDIGVSKNHNFVLSNNCVVHNCVPYQYLKNTVYEGRLSMFKSDRLYDEFVSVERNINTGKVDHPPNGHKDALDAVCGSVFNASKFAEQYAFDYGETLETLMMANDVPEETPVVDKQQVVVDFTSELAKIFTGSELKDNNPKPLEDFDWSIY